MKTKSTIFLFLVTVSVAALAVLVWNEERMSGPEFVNLTHKHLSPVVKVEELYPSMFGPSDTVLDMKISEREPELVWITGYRAEMVDPSATERRPDELMCHNTLSFHATAEAHRAVLGSGSYRTRRLFTLSQGQSTVEFPKGFGIPASSAEPYMLQSQVLNLREELIGTEVRHQVKTDFVPDSEVDGEMKPLMLVDFGIALEVTNPQAEEQVDDPLSCAIDAGGQPKAHNPATGQEITSHWVVPPGEEKRTTYVGRPFPYDTTAHYICIHMHPYAKSLTLKDITTGETVYTAYCHPTEDGRGLAKVDYYSSREGLKVYKNHEYEVISHYHNTSDEEHTAMAFMLMYVEDKKFQKPDPEELAKRTVEFCGGL